MKPNQYRPDIDGLRAIAILSVVGFHAFPAWVPGGFIGVDIFFVISGFLITGILLSNLRDNKFSIAGFYARRIRRIFPALIAMLISVLAFGYFFLWPDEYAHLAEHAAGGAGFIVNILLQHETGYFAGNAETKPLLHLWSLGVEEQFYIFWPLMLWAAWKAKHHAGLMIALVIAASFAANIWLASHNTIADFYSIFSRFWELLAGGALAWWMQKMPQILPRTRAESLSITGALLIALSAFALDKTATFPGWLALLPICGALSLIAAGDSAVINRKILANPATIYIGLISYPLYLWHWPLLSFARILSGEEPARSIRIAMVIMAFIFAILTYHFIEKPIREKTFTKKRLGLLITAMIVIASFSLAVSITKGLPQRFAAYGSAERDLNSERMIKEWGKNVRFHTCHLEDPEETQQTPECIESRRPLIWLWGDSHAASLYPGLKHLQATQNFGIAQVTQAGCPPLFDVPKLNFRPNCNAVNRRILQQAVTEKPEIILLNAAWIHTDYPMDDADIIKHLNDTLAQIRGAVPGAKIIVMVRRRAGSRRCLPSIATL